MKKENIYSPVYEYLLCEFGQQLLLDFADFSTENREIIDYAMGAVDLNEPLVETAILQIRIYEDRLNYREAFWMYCLEDDMGGD